MPTDTMAAAPAVDGREIEVITKDGELVSGLPAGYENAGTSSLAVSLARAEVDQQIATAHAFPRSITRAVQNITTLATLDEETAIECIYALPRGGKAIKGPSVRLAEIIASQWCNVRIGTRVVHVDRIEKYVEAEGVFHDLETNMAITARVRRRISDKKGKLLSEDMIVVTGNAACSIAKRNAILGGVPKAVWRKAYATVEQVIAGDIKTLSERREKAMKAFAAFGVTPEQVITSLGVAGLDDINLEHMTTLTGMHSAIKSGEATVEEMFPPVAAAIEKPKGLNGALDALAATAKPEADTAAKAATAPAPATTAPASTPAGQTASTESAAPARPTVAEQAKLKDFHHALDAALSVAKVERILGEFWKDAPLVEGTSLQRGAAAIVAAHTKRVAGKSSPAEVDQAVREWIA